MSKLGSEKTWKDLKFQKYTLKPWNYDLKCKKIGSEKLETRYLNFAKIDSWKLWR